MKKIKEKWGHLLDSDTGFHDMKDVILKAIPDLLTRMDEKDHEASLLETQLSAFSSRGGGRNNYNRGRGQPGGSRGLFRPRQTQTGRELTRRFCRLCQASRCPVRVYTSHNMSECNRWTRNDVEDLRVMMCGRGEIDPHCLLCVPTGNCYNIRFL